MNNQNFIAPDNILHETLHRNARILAIDVGTKTLGLATGLMESQIASPLRVVRRNKYKNDILEIQKAIKEWEIKAIIFGLPLNMDGSSGARVQATKTIARNIARDTNLPYDFQDERLSTSAATDRLINIGVRPSSRHNVIDAHAAQIILEGYFYRIFGSKE